MEGTANGESSASGNSTSVASTNNRGSKKRNRNKENDNLNSKSGLSNNVASSSTSNNNNSNKNNNSTTNSSLPPIEQIRNAANKLVNECPPYVHLSSKDSAPPPQLKIDDGRLVIRGGYRGYRMSRASHGVSSGNYFYEVLILPPPTAREVVASLPNNVRLGSTLQKQLEDQLLYEDQQEQILSSNKNDDDQQPPPAANVSGKRRKGRNVNSNHTQYLTGHLRLGWSMRTGELQAPVGYDRWSYGIRSIQGSRVHNSRREDKWGGVPFYPGDVLGLCISLVDPSDDNGAKKKSKTNPNHSATTSSSDNNTNHIRFFKNGEAMGQFILSKNTRSGGAAFDDIQPGTYYPALSTYMGGTAKVNFGPHFICPINSSQLPTGMKLKPISELSTSPLPPKEAVQIAIKDNKISNKSLPKSSKSSLNTDNDAFKEAIHVESEIRYNCYQSYLLKNINDVKKYRIERGVSINDLPKDDEDKIKLKPDDIKSNKKDDNDDVKMKESTAPDIAKSNNVEVQSKDKESAIASATSVEF